MGYGETEVALLLGHYAALEGRRGRAWVAVRLIDIDRALAALPEEERTAVVLHGIRQRTLADTARAVGVSLTTIHRRYWSGVHRMVDYLNGRL